MLYGNTCMVAVRSNDSAVHDSRRTNSYMYRCMAQCIRPGHVTCGKYSGTCVRYYASSEASRAGRSKARRIKKNNKGSSEVSVGKMRRMLAEAIVAFRSQFRPEAFRQSIGWTVVHIYY